MKTLLLFLLFPIFTFSQSFDCCKTVADVEKMLQGDWVLANGIPNQVYCFQLMEGSGDLLMFNLNDNNILEEKRRSSISIKEKDGKFFMEVNTLYGVVEYKILVLNEIKFISRNKDFSVEYLKVKD